MLQGMCVKCRGRGVRKAPSREEEVCGLAPTPARALLYGGPRRGRATDRSYISSHISLPPHFAWDLEQLALTCVWHAWWSSVSHQGCNPNPRRLAPPGDAACGATRLAQQCVLAG